MKRIGQFVLLKIFLLLMVPESFCLAQKELNTEILPGANGIFEYLPYLKAKKVGLVVNQSSKIGQRHLIDSLKFYNINITLILTPEHGLAGIAQDGEVVNDMSYKGIPVISLYGSKKKPSIEDLQKIDILVFDLQDVGVRFYTYISTLTYCMESCAENNVPLLILDRPNPNGFYIDGPVLEADQKSFVGLHPVPVVYGMTIGEYAQMVKGEGWISHAEKLLLQIVKCINYIHSSFYQLPEKPSPNLPNMLSVYLYPSLCFFEGTQVSVGRATSSPFQIFGSPYFPPTGFSFIPIKGENTSNSPLYSGIKCYGENLQTINIADLQHSSTIELSYLISAYQKLGVGDVFFNDYFNKLAGNTKLKQQIMEGKTGNEIRESWKFDIDNFKKIRVKYLLYPDF